MSYTNSALVNHTRISPNRNSPRKHAIDTITTHCVVGQVSVETLGNIFANPNREASSNYGIGYDGRVGMYVEERDRSWCSSSPDNDHRAVTIEVASDMSEPYAVTGKAYAALINLVADICKRNGIKKLVWSTDKNTRVYHLNGANMTVHRDFDNKSCPGTYLYNHHADIAAKVNAKLGAASTPAKPTPKPSTPKPTCTGDLTYSAYAGCHWLPQVKNCEDYAGNFGQAMEGLKINAKNCDIYYRVHLRGGGWLPEIKNSGAGADGYAGIYGEQIDGVQIRTPVGFVDCRVHIKGGGWLSWVRFGSKYNSGADGYAGIYGSAIDAIQME